MIVRYRRGRRTTVGDAVPVRPTAMLTITARACVQRQWHDATKTPVKRRLRGIVIGVVELIEEQRHRQAEHQTRESEMEAAQARHQAAVRQRPEATSQLTRGVTSLRYIFVSVSSTESKGTSPRRFRMGNTFSARSQLSSRRSRLDSTARSGGRSSSIVPERPRITPTQS